MIIKSYLAYPTKGQRVQLEETLSAIAGCEVIPATNRELLVLVTESANQEAEKALVAQIEGSASLQTLTLVSGHNEAVAPGA